MDSIEKNENESKLDWDINPIETKISTG